MTRTNTATRGGRGRPVRGVFLLACGLVAAVWAASHFSAEARVRRATARLTALVQKDGPESPVTLGLAANRFGGYLATNAVLEVEGGGPLAESRQEAVQLFVQVRDLCTQIDLADPEIAAVARASGEVAARVQARYRFIAAAGPVAEGEGTAELQWVRGADGWQIRRAVLQPDEREALPREWR